LLEVVLFLKLTFDENNRKDGLCQYEEAVKYHNTLDIKDANTCMALSL
jgi:hypothetical protein